MQQTNRTLWEEVITPLSSKSISIQINVAKFIKPLLRSRSTSGAVDTDYVSNIRTVTKFATETVQSNVPYKVFAFKLLCLSNIGFCLKLGLLETAGPITDISLSKGPNRIGVFPLHLRTETGWVSETVCFLFRIAWFLDFVHRPAFYVNTREHSVSEPWSVSVLRWRGKTPTLLGPSERASLPSRNGNSNCMKYRPIEIIRAEVATSPLYRFPSYVGSLRKRRSSD
jgi:hypothetical protein